MDVDLSPETIIRIYHVAPFCLANGRILATDGTRFVIVNAMTALVRVRVVSALIVTNFLSVPSLFVFPKPCCRLVDSTSCSLNEISH